jgi:hypothetical protein
MTDAQSVALCAHLSPGPYPFESVLILDDHLGPTDWLVRCRACRRPYLLEMLDWREKLRLYRIRRPDAQAVEGLMRDLDRGSCDLRRAGEQVRHLGLSSRRLSELALLDLGQAVLVRTIDVPGDQPIPGASWRELPCDGAWIRRFD